MNIQGGGGDRAHEATTVLVREAYAASGDPAKYPEQLREGLRPWKPYKLYFAGQGIGRGGGRGGAGGGAPAAAAPGVHVDRVDLSLYDPLLGRTCQEISADARSNHKCQGTSSLPPLPGIAAGGRGGPGGGPGGGRGGPAGAGAGGPAAAGSPYTLVDTAISGAMEKPESTLFDGIDLTLAGLARYAGATPPAALTGGLAAISAAAQQAKQVFDSGNDAGTAPPIEAGLIALRALRANLASMGLTDAARYEIDFRLKNKEQDYENAVIAAHGLTFNVIANDGLVIGGQPISVSLGAVNRGATDVTIDASIAGFDERGRVHAGRNQEGWRLLVHLRRRRCRRARRSPTRTSRTRTGRTRRARPATRSIRACRLACRSRRRRSARSSRSRRAPSR